MLIESKAVVQMALLMGSTWLVNTVVFVAILLTILGANGVARSAAVGGIRGLYAALFISLIANVVVPLDAFLMLSHGLQLLLASSLMAAPIFFGGVIFARSFAASGNPNVALGFNLAGAMLGGFSEYGSMLFGFQGLSIIALAFYTLSMPMTLRRAPE